MSSNPPSQSPESSPGSPVSSDDMLPPIEEPSGRFILQLFVVPAVIVTVVLLLGLLVTKLANRGRDNPEELVAALRGGNQMRWQTANDLVTMLQQERRYPELRKSAELAQEIAKLLEEEIEAGDDEPTVVDMRCFLCRVLGELLVDDGTDALLTAAADDPQTIVQREAMRALAVRAYNFSAMDPPRRLQHPRLLETITTLANSQNEVLRSETAFLLGALSLPPHYEPVYTEELEKLVDDLYTDARYNAALALARSGNLRAEEAVAEMFSADGLRASYQTEQQEEQRPFKRNTLLKNALEAAENLANENPSADLSQLTAALETFLSEAPAWKEPAKVPEKLLDRAHEVLASIDSRDG